MASKNQQELLKFLGPEYSMKEIDLELCIYRKIILAMILKFLVHIGKIILSAFMFGIFPTVTGFQQLWLKNTLIFPTGQT